MFLDVIGVLLLVALLVFGAGALVRCSAMPETP